MKIIEMRRHLHIIICVAVGILIGIITAQAQEKFGNWEFDRTVYDFGNVRISDGPQSCSFQVKNTGSTPAVIYQVASSCGCTGVKWTREPIAPGAEGKISVTYSNDEGPYPFEKTLTVYVSDYKKPIILKIRGVSHEKKKSLEEMFPVRISSLAMRSAEIKCGNMEQEGQKSDVIMIGNLSGKALKIGFDDVSPELKISVSPNPVPARGTAEITYTLSASRTKWGKNYYYATPVLNGVKQKKSIAIWAFTKENFNGLSDSQKSKAARPMMQESTFSFNRMKKGEMIKAEFVMENQGKETLKIYKVDSDVPFFLCSEIPEILPGKNTKIKLEIDSGKLPEGETLIVVTFTTNSPLRPIVNVFVTGYLQ